MDKERIQDSKTHPVSKSNILLDGIFRKSTKSGGGNCVEVAIDNSGSVRVRDTKDRNGAVLEFTHDEWVAFLSGVRAGEFDI